MKKREIIMILIALISIASQVFFDLKIPEFVNQLTVIATTPGSDNSQTYSIGAMMFLCLVASLILSILAGYFSARAAAGFAQTIRKDLFDKVMSYSDKEISEFSIPSLIIRCTNDITQIQNLIAMGLQIIVKSPLMAVWALTKILGKNWEFTLLTAIFVIIVCICVFFNMIIVMPKFRFIQKITDKINLLVRENISGINVVHAFNAENFQISKFETENKRLTKNQLFIQRSFSLLVPVIQGAMSSLWFAIYWLGAALLIPMAVPDRIIFFGDIVSFAMYATYVLSSFMMMTMIFMLVPPAQASSERIKEVFDQQASLFPGKLQKIDKVNIGETIIKFKDVSFTYPKMIKPNLKDINLDIKKGQTVAIIGSTSCGKSTLVNLIMRFYDATKGQIELANNNITHYTFDALYDNLSLVTQKPVVFYGTIKENVVFGLNTEDINDSDIDKALEIAQAKEFVDKLPDGLNTIVSQDGKNLSGGQKQRLSIARAIMRKPEVLIMDDSSSALDYKTDSNLRISLRKNLKDCTLIIVAQRIGTIKNADQIIVLDNGMISGIGTHKELLSNCQQYREIAESQMRPEELEKI